jgi:hypothetical protein
MEEFFGCIGTLIGYALVYGIVLFVIVKAVKFIWFLA